MALSIMDGIDTWYTSNPAVNSGYEGNQEMEQILKILSMLLIAKSSKIITYTNNNNCAWNIHCYDGLVRYSNKSEELIGFDNGILTRQIMKLNSKSSG